MVYLAGIKLLPKEISWSTSNVFREVRILELVYELFPEGTAIDPIDQVKMPQRLGCWINHSRLHAPYPRKERTIAICKAYQFLDHDDSLHSDL